MTMFIRDASLAQWMAAWKRFDSLQQCWISQWIEYMCMCGYVVRCRSRQYKIYGHIRETKIKMLVQKRKTGIIYTPGWTFYFCLYIMHWKSLREKCLYTYQKKQSYHLYFLFMVKMMIFIIKCSEKFWNK